MTGAQQLRAESRKVCGQLASSSDMTMRQASSCRLRAASAAQGVVRTTSST